MNDDSIDKLYRDIYGMFPWMPSQILIHEEFELGRFKAGSTAAIANNIILNILESEEKN